MPSPAWFMSIKGQHCSMLLLDEAGVGPSMASGLVAWRTRYACGGCGMRCCPLMVTSTRERSDRNWSIYFVSTIEAT